MAVLFLAAPVAGEETVPAPFVGCASDGQMGPQPPPATGETPLLSKRDAALLSWYAFSDQGVLAPRGWHCFGLYGSAGSSLIVTPEPHGAELLNQSLKGPAVERVFRFSSTSGRFDVADAAAGLFPTARQFVRGVAAEEMAKIHPWKPTPADRIVSRTDKRVEFITAAGRRGLGTKGRMVPSADPIRSAIFLDSEGDLTAIHVRLAPADARLAPLIVQH